MARTITSKPFGLSLSKPFPFEEGQPFDKLRANGFRSAHS